MAPTPHRLYVVAPIPLRQTAVGHEIIVTDTPGQTAYDVILGGLVGYNAAQAGAGGHRLLAVLVKDEVGKVLGGLWGSTAWEWLFVHLFWLPEGLRGDGLGRDLLHRAEVEALSRGCRNAWLDTYSFQARGFYEKLGYRVFGTLVDYPPGHHRFFLQKRLSKRSSSQASARSPR